MPMVKYNKGSGGSKTTSTSGKSTAASKVVSYAAPSQAWKPPSAATAQQIAAENENARYRQQANSETLYRGSSFAPGEFETALLASASGRYDPVASAAELETARQAAARVRFNSLSNYVRPYSLSFLPGINPNSPLVQEAMLAGLRYQEAANKYQQWLRTRPEASMLASNAPNWMVGVGDLRNPSQKGSNYGNSQAINSGGGYGYDYGYGGGYWGGGGGGGGYTAPSQVTYWNGKLVNWRI